MAFIGMRLATHPSVVNILSSMFLLYFSYWLFARNLFKIKQKEEPDSRISHILKCRQGLNGKLELDSHELTIAAGIVLPSENSTRFEDIGGMEGIKKQVYNDLLIPIRKSERFKGKLTTIPKGLLLYGPPGTGKTTIAKAIASEGDYIFINLKLSDVYQKYVGESEKLVVATFSLARKIQPCIIFIDELDSTFGSRNGSEHAFQRNVMSTFMSEWDGLLSGKTQTILIGCTNRPSDIDEAIQRRLEKSIYVGLPTLEERESILRIILKSEELDAGFSYKKIAEKTQDWSGSQLRSMCEHVARSNVARDLHLEDVQPMTTQDFLDSIHLFAPARNEEQRQQFNIDLSQFTNEILRMTNNNSSNSSNRRGRR
eukprot:TRINITY_DN7207_c0_g1_i1.p1 TRINITY_DN7207_c0_g1~~TRINITY_DN7207_c0_g1_i1.p1  ORF type:complete len:430 (+),score=100.28 TRINITY_DN7207_c0_g1_i1:183-1292(+)